MVRRIFQAITAQADFCGECVDGAVKIHLTADTIFASGYDVAINPGNKVEATILGEGTSSSGEFSLVPLQPYTLKVDASFPNTAGEGGWYWGVRIDACSWGTNYFNQSGIPYGEDYMVPLSDNTGSMIVEFYGGGLNYDIRGLVTDEGSYVPYLCTIMLLPLGENSGWQENCQPGGKPEQGPSMQPPKVETTGSPASPDTKSNIFDSISLGLKNATTPAGNIIWTVDHLSAEAFEIGNVKIPGDITEADGGDSLGAVFDGNGDLYQVRTQDTLAEISAITGGVQVLLYAPEDLEDTSGRFFGDPFVLKGTASPTYSWQVTNTSPSGHPYTEATIVENFYGMTGTVTNTWKYRQVVNGSSQPIGWVLEKVEGSSVVASTTQTALINGNGNVEHTGLTPKEVQL